MTQRFTNGISKVSKAARAALLLAIIVATPALLSAQPRCNQYSLRGSYAFHFMGSQVTTQGSSQITTQIAMVGIETFDGNGKTTMTESASFGGFVTKATISGTYTVKDDCSGSIVGTFPDGSIGHLDFVIADNGRTIYAIEMDMGVILSGVFKQQ